ncbi:hypothetical protein EDB89DRAFT_2075644 [Lactarius sanguifluus]|nr:hypothetical protein EDB89DRAFT_2075644 [Lactarius sanguifluus]
MRKGCPPSARSPARVSHNTLPTPEDAVTSFSHPRSDAPTFPFARSPPPGLRARKPIARLRGRRDTPPFAVRVRVAPTRSVYPPSRARISPRARRINRGAGYAVLAAPRGMRGWMRKAGGWAAFGVGRTGPPASPGMCGAPTLLQACAGGVGRVIPGPMAWPTQRGLVAGAKPPARPACKGRAVRGAWDWAGIARTEGTGACRPSSYVRGQGRGGAWGWDGVTRAEGMGWTCRPSSGVRG